MSKDTQAPNWVQEYLEWNGQAEDLPRSGSSGEPSTQASERFVAAYLEWIDAAAPNVSPRRTAGDSKLGQQHRRKVSRHAILEEATA